jgi:hypothetical protein
MPEHPRSPSNVSEWRLPVPDPTILTTEALHREINALKELLQARFDAMERATEIRDRHMKELEGMIGVKVEQLQELHAEKFRSIAVQFAERDTRTEQTSRDSKVAVDAALQAAKEAVGEQNRSSALAISKSEAATTKQIDQQGTLIQTTTLGLNDKIDDLKERLTSIEGRSKGMADGWGLIVGGIMLVVAVVTVIVVLTTRHAP